MGLHCYHCKQKAKYEVVEGADFPHHFWHDVSYCPNKIHVYGQNRKQAKKDFIEGNRGSSDGIVW